MVPLSQEGAEATSLMPTTLLEPLQLLDSIHTTLTGGADEHGRQDPERPPPVPSAAVAQGRTTSDHRVAQLCLGHGGRIQAPYVP